MNENRTTETSTQLLPGPVEELAGRMFECVDIQMAIESGQFTTIGEVLEAVKARSAVIDKILREAGAFDGVRTLTQAEFAEAKRQVDEHMFLAGVDPSELTRQ